MTAGRDPRVVLRAVGAVAGVTMRAPVRNGFFALAVALGLIHLALFTTDLAPDEAAARARFFDHAATGTLALLVVGGLVLGLDGRSREAGPARGPEVRAAGPGAAFLGAALGSTAVLVALAACLGGAAAIHDAVRFGLAGDEAMPVRAFARPLDGLSPYRRLRLDAAGDDAMLTFPFVGRPRPGGGTLVSGSFAPRLALLREGGGPRREAPVEVTVRDPDGSWSARERVTIRAGRPGGFDVVVPAGVPRPERLRVAFRSLAPDYAIGLAPRDVTLIGPARPAAGAMLVASLAAALFAAFGATIARAAAMAFGRTVGLLAGLAVLIVAASFELLDLDLMRGAPAGTRLAVLETARLLVPDLAAFDPAGHLARGLAIPAAAVGGLALRLGATALALALALRVGERGRTR